MKLHGVVLALGLLACGGKGGSSTTPLVVGAEPAAEEPGAGAATPEPSCLAECRGRHPQAPDPAAYAAYCDELCTPVAAGAEAPEPCVRSCEASQEPDAADDEECQQTCAGVPQISDESMSACVDACTAAGNGEPGCKTDCDPDPYDECRYDPCD